MAEITKTKAQDLTPDEASQLLQWAGWAAYGLTCDLTIQGVLDLYHASGDYVSLEGWLQEGPDAGATYDRIAKKRAA